MEYRSWPDDAAAPQPLLFGAFVRRTRERHGWSQDALADAIQRDRSWLSRIEHHDRVGYLAPPDVVYRLSDVLGVSVARLVLSSYGLGHLNVHDDPGATPPGLDGMVVTVEDSTIDEDLKRLLIGCIHAVRELHQHRRQNAPQVGVDHDGHDDDDGQNADHRFER